MRYGIETDDHRAEVETGPDGQMDLSLSTKAGRVLAHGTCKPDPGNGWIAVGDWNAGEPEVALVTPDDSAVYVNPEWLGGLWRLHVFARSAAEALESAAMEAKAVLRPPEMPSGPVPIPAAWRTSA